MRFNKSATVKALTLAVLLGGFSMSEGFAATITVENLSDVFVQDDSCSLREAITNANSDDTDSGDCPAGTGVDTIEFSVSGTIPLSATLPAIFATDLLTIDGSGQAITLSGQNTVRVMAVSDGGVLKLQDLTITQGLSPGPPPFLGGGVKVEGSGSLTVERVTFSANVADFGGAVYNLGSFMAIESTFHGNTGFINSGAISGGGTVFVDRCTFSENSAPAGGGAIKVQGGTMTVVSSTFSGNMANNGAAGSGGAIYLNSGTISVANSTFSGNQSALAGSAIFVSLGTLTLTDSIVANGMTGVNCGGTITDGGGNLTWPALDASCPGAAGDPMLFPLGNNGGFTETFELHTGSAAYDSLTNVFCPAFDQRGLARPRGEGCDTGAVEGIGTPGFIFFGDFETEDFSGWSTINPEP